jgi:hypothetical protein
MAGITGNDSPAASLPWMPTEAGQVKQTTLPGDRETQREIPVLTADRPRRHHDRHCLLFRISLAHRKGTIFRATPLASRARPGIIASRLTSRAGIIACPAGRGPNQLTGVSAPVEGRKWERLTMAVSILRTTLSSSTRYLMGSVAVRSGVTIRVPVDALQRRIWNAIKAVHRPGLRRFRRRNRHRTGLPRER